MHKCYQREFNTYTHEWNFKQKNLIRHHSVQTRWQRAKQIITANEGIESRQTYMT